MAKCTYKLPEDFLKKLSSLGSHMDEVSEKVLQAGGEVVLQKTRSNLVSVLSGESSGELVSALGLSGVRLDRNGNPNIKVGFDEPRRDGSSNAMVANIIEYGKHNQPAKPFLKPAKSQSKSECIDTMVATLEKEIKKL
ncbi:MAG: HK97 gp10 family phage protein [Clostridia bacterium]|nr:HK97 gp10 family phage protein [Clostridia bacterium]